LLRAAVGLVDYAGDVLVDGVSLSLRSRSRRAALLAYVPQNPLLPYDMTALEYVLLGRAPFVSYFATESRHDRALADVLRRLDERVRRPPIGTVERRRATAAGDRSRFATEAPILLLDSHERSASGAAAGTRARRTTTARPRPDCGRRCTT
jgi:iron complex transport system ATP-binding protein